MLVTQDEALHRRARWKCNMCFGEDPESRFTHAELGYNYRMSSLQAAMGAQQLAHLPEAVERKVAIGERYNRLLAGISGITRPPAAAWVKNVYWAYCILVNARALGVGRSAVQRLLWRAGIETRRAFTPVHRQPFLGLLAKPDEFPISRRIAEEGILLPTFVGLDDEMIDRVVGALADIRAGRLREH
jgi:perosamine synthetase